MTNTALLDETTLLLQDLLAASKGAERLISVMFELGALEGEPFLSIWSHLERAINKAQVALNTGRQEGK